MLTFEIINYFGNLLYWVNNNLIDRDMFLNECEKMLSIKDDEFNNCVKQAIEIVKAAE